MLGNGGTTNTMVRAPTPMAVVLIQGTYMSGDSRTAISMVRAPTPGVMVKSMLGE